MSLEMPPAVELETTVEIPPIPRSKLGDWTWELVKEFPTQGEWTEEEYLALESNRLIEFTDGVLEFLTMPKLFHGKIARFLSDMLRSFVTAHRLGDVFWAPISVKLRPGILREPDVFFLSTQRLSRGDDPPVGADLVMEVVSPDAKDRVRDIKQKRREYATAGIPEYWIVDPETETITVLTLPAGANEYAEHGVFRADQIATSVLLSEFAIDVTACFAAGKGYVDQG